MRQPETLGLRRRGRLVRAAARASWSDRDGFTLVELAVVMVILAILATIAIAVFLGQREKAQRSSAISSLRNTLVLAEAIRMEGGAYTSQPEAYEQESGGAFTFTNGASTGQTVVSIATFDGGSEQGTGRTLVVAALGGADCFWARRSLEDGQDVRGRSAADGDCDASSFAATTGTDW